MIRGKHITSKVIELIRPITVCANPACERPIHKGEQVWAKGKDLYCHLGCFAKTIKK